MLFLRKEKTLNIMDDQYSQGSLPDFDVVRSTQFVDDFSRSVSIYCSADVQLACTT